MRRDIIYLWSYLLLIKAPITQAKSSKSGYLCERCLVNLLEQRLDNNYIHPRANEKKEKNRGSTSPGQKFSQSAVLVSPSAALKSVIVSLPEPQENESAPSSPVNMSLLLSSKSWSSPDSPITLSFPLPP
jgi:hypothetical protein